MLCIVCCVLHFAFVGGRYCVQAMEVISNRTRDMSWDTMLLNSRGDGWLDRNSAEVLWDSVNYSNKKSTFNAFMNMRRQVDREAKRNQFATNPLRKRSVHVAEIRPLSWIDPGPEQYFTSS